VNRIYHCTCL